MTHRPSGLFGRGIGSKPGHRDLDIHQILFRNRRAIQCSRNRPLLQSLARSSEPPRAAIRTCPLVLWLLSDNDVGDCSLRCCQVIFTLQGAGRKWCGRFGAAN